MIHVFDQLATLAKAGKKLNNVNSFTALYEIVFELVEEIYESKTLAIFLKDPPDGAMTVVAARGYDEEVVNQFRSDQGIVGHVVSSGKPQLATETVNDPQYVNGVPGAVSEMTVPLCAGDEIIGALDMGSKKARFTEADLTLFATFGEQVATAVCNVRLQADLKERARKLAAIAKAGQSLTSISDLDELLARILESTRKALHLDACAIQLWDEYRANLVVVAAEGYDRNVIGLKVPLGVGVTGKVAAENRPSLIPDVKEVADHVNDLSGYRSELAVPLVFRDEVIGVLNAGHREPNRFDETDLLHATIFADQAAGALGNTNILADLDRATHEVNLLTSRLNLLNATSSKVNGITNLDTLLDEILSMALNTLEFERITVLLPEPSEFHLKVHRAHGYPEGTVGLRVPIDKSITGEAYRTGISVLAPDVREDPRYVEGSPGGRSEIAAPLKVDNDVVGVLDAESVGDNVLTEGDLKVLEMLASQVATALNNARMISRLKKRGKRFRLLNDAACTLGSIHTVNKLVEEIIKLAKETLDLDRCALLLVDPETKELKVDASQGYGDINGMTIPLGKGITGITALAGDPILVKDTTKDERYIDGEAGGRCEMASPLQVYDQVIGVLDTESSILNAFGEEDLELFSAFAAHAAMAIHNARLFQELKKTNK
ncbi:MAG: GAF domain-containing protein [Proteobacteria bacterium]|nr:GAF domain-containing protein [Pseudomonadota bacterium]